MKRRVFGLGEQEAHPAGTGRMLADGLRHATAHVLQSLMRKGSAGGMARLSAQTAPSARMPAT